MIGAKVTHIKYKPLIPAEGLDTFKPELILRRLKKETLKQIRDKITQTVFSSAAKRALREGLKIQVGDKSITVTATHPAFIPLLVGKKEQQMRWLTKATRPIPIVTESGELIFRSATAKSMDDGKWIHPGHQPTTVIERARVEARKVIKEKVRKELRKHMRAALLGER